MSEHPADQASLALHAASQGGVTGRQEFPAGRDRECLIRLNDRADALTLDGRGGADTYNVTFRGPAQPVSGYAIDVSDSGIDAAADALAVTGSMQADLLRLRASTAPAGLASVASLASDPAIAQIVTYTKSIATLSVAAGGGNDTVLVDDNWAVTTIEGGEGQNSYEVGTLSANAVPDLGATLVAGGQYLSNGVSYRTTITGGGGGDSFTVRRNLAAVALNGGAGGDAFVVSGFADPSGQPLVNAEVGVDGGGGTANTLEVTGTGFADAFSITGTKVSGAGVSATYARIQSLTVIAGDGADAVAVVSTHTGTTTVEGDAGGDTVTIESTAGLLTVDGGADADTVNVRGIGAATTVNGGLGADTVNVGSTSPGTGGNVNAIAALLTVNGQGGSDTLNVDDTGDTLANTGTLTGTLLTGLGMAGSITYGTCEALTIGLGSAGDTFTIAGTHAGTTLLDATGGKDTVNVSATSGFTTVTAGDDDDTVNVGSGDLDPLQGPVTVTGGSGNDKLRIDDGVDINTKSVNYRVTPSQVTSSARPGASARAFAGLAYDGSTEWLSLTGTNAANTFNVVPGRATELQINGNLPAPGTVRPRLGDKLLIDLTTVCDSWLTLTPGVPGSGAWAFGDALPVQFTSIEKFNDSQMAVFSDVGVASTYGVRVFDVPSGLLKFELPAEQLYGANSIVGVRGVMGDLTGDGFADLIVGPNKGVLDATVRIFDGIDARLVRELVPYPDRGRHVGGINVAVGDVDGDGWNDVLVAPAAGVSAPVRAFSGDPTRFLAKVGQDLWPLGRKSTSELMVVVADQNLDGPANRGQVFVASAVNGIAAVQSFTLDANSGWSAPAGGRFLPFGTAVVRGAPRLSAGDVNGDGVQDLFVARPNDGSGMVRLFDGRRPGVALGKDFATIPSRKPANDQTTFAFDLNGDGRDETIATFRSTIGMIPEVFRFQLSANDLSAPPSQMGRFSANVSSAKELTGYWMVDGRAASISQIGQEITLTYPDGRTAKGLLVGTRFINVPSEKINGEINGGVITWNKGRAPWQRVAVTGTYVSNGVLFRVQQQGTVVRVWSDGGDYGSGKIDAAGRIIPNASSGRLGGSIFDIRWAGNSLGRRFEAPTAYLDAKGKKVRMFETANGDLCFVEASGKAALGRWIAPGKVQVNEWGGMVGTMSNGGITWNGNRQLWKKV